MGGCQNYGPFLGTINIRCRTIIGAQKGTIILTTTRIEGVIFKDDGGKNASSQDDLFSGKRKSKTRHSLHELFKLNSQPLAAQALDSPKAPKYPNSEALRGQYPETIKIDNLNPNKPPMGFSTWM